MAKNKIHEIRKKETTLKKKITFSRETKKLFSIKLKLKITISGSTILKKENTSLKTIKAIKEAQNYQKKS